MIISRDTERLFTIKMTPRYIGVIFAGLMLAATLLVYAIIAAGAERRSGGMSRTPDGAPVLLFLVGVPVLVFLDWRRNRKSLTFDSEARKVTVIGSKSAIYSVDEIERFMLGSTVAASKPAAQIDIQLKDGKRVGSGINSSFGDPEISERAIGILNERLKAASAYV